MAIDASIYSQIQQPQAQNPLASLAQAYQIKAYQGALDKSDRETASQNRLAELARQSFNPETGAIDANKMRAGLAQAGDFGALTTFEKTQADQAKATREANKAKLEEGLKHFEVVGQIMNGVRDQASLDLARQQAAQIFGADAAQNIPRVYDPQVIAQNQARAMSVKDQLEQQYKALTFGETQRHNQATEGLTASGQAVTQRGQDLTRQSAVEGQNVTKRGQDLVNQRALDAQGGGGKMTEDQGKATGWLVQAENAFANMKAAGFDKDGNPLPASRPGVADMIANSPLGGGLGNWLRSPDRQKFVQGASSLSESLLRAATGAGVNKDEAKQKIEELTPQWGEDEGTTKQKMAAIPLYIESLKVRAGPGAAKAQQVLASQDGGTPPAPVSGVISVTNAADYAKVPSGATYTTPDGKTRRKP